ncbi:hypothetical protein KIN20_009174 [Parelaphostrongylus tenuis]|uniref:Uncharacterized protein n=1 Tax=Parelaphostrongylus tenuis TaxID=148309 RepID=A0AAD5QN70_PARTN|nr:hypothetical protein KIN20_009174 [Parelaphostrongylus tenuis]
MQLLRTALQTVITREQQVERKEKMDQINSAAPLSSATCTSKTTLKTTDAILMSQTFDVCVERRLLNQ